MNKHLHRLIHDFKIDIVGKAGVELYGTTCLDAEEIYPFKVAAWLAVDAEGIKTTANGKFAMPNRVLDFILIYGANPETVAGFEPELWRLLKFGGVVYADMDCEFDFAYHGWQRITAYDTASLFGKKAPNCPFQLGMLEGNAKNIMKRTGRKLIGIAECGQTKYGMIYKWQLSDCTLYFEKISPMTRYMVMDIAPKEG